MFDHISDIPYDQCHIYKSIYSPLEYDFIKTSFKVQLFCLNFCSKDGFG